MSVKKLYIPRKNVKILRKTKQFPRTKLQNTENF